MADDTKDAEAKLEKLAERVRQAHKELHPVKREHINLVREVARHAWDEKHNQTSKTDEKTKQQENEEGHSH
jgi:hypothetical protein